jgi:hypothetical protein
MWLAGSPLFARGGAAALSVADVFSTDLLTSGVLTVNNGLDMAGFGGLVWTKNRSFSSSHLLQDSARGTAATNQLSTNSASGEGQVSSIGNRISSFNADGWTRTLDVGDTTSGDALSPQFNVAWTFRRAPKFFDVVTYTGNGTAGRTIAHNLGVAPGMVVVKRRDSASSWFATHRSLSTDSFLTLDTTGASQTSIGINNHTSTTFRALGNVSGATYVAYLFAHDTDPSGVIQCGLAANNAKTTLPWQPQFLLYKAVSSVTNWYMFDASRPNDLFANSSTAESTTALVSFQSDGFTLVNIAASNFIYLAIRAEGT